ncbi:MAG: hypothetical protein HY880_06815 [Deltaproteobacteria bacterium]|nr:hypothetical protein [Deltaproteobacteria bacterium]
MVLFLLLLFGCAPKIEGPLYLYPDPDLAPGYVSILNKAVYETKDVRITLRPLEKGISTGSDFIDMLIEDNYRLFEMEMANLSGDKKVVYNPSHTSLMDNRFGYKKPLDYTGLYDIALKLEKGPKALNEVKGRFYDLNESVSAGAKVSKILIFKPVTDKSTKYTVVMNLVYIGTESINLRFSFVLRPRR